MANLPEYLDPRTVAQLDRLQVVAHHLVHGFLRGQHLSAAKGSSNEFAEHRPYVRGDEVRHIDWRTFGKTDRFYLKEYDDESNLRATLLIDTSASMAFQSEGVTKLRYASCLAAALGYLLLGQRDAVGLALVDSGLRRYIPPKATAEHLAGIFRIMEEYRPSSTTALGPSLHALAGRQTSRSLVVILSDLLDDPTQILRGLTHLRHRLCDVIVFHVLDPAETDLPYTSWMVFRDSEDPSTELRVDARQVRGLYVENFRNHCETLRKGCGAAGVDYVRLRTDVPFELALAKFLVARRRYR